MTSLAPRSTTARIGLAIVLLFTLAALAAPVIAQHDPAAIDPARRLAPPSAEHWLGADQLGRDVMSRLLYGARWSLGIVTLATVVIMGLGVGLGLVAGYAGGRTDAILMRAVDILLAVPSLLLALAILGMLGPGLVSMLIALASVWWVSYARIVRGMVVSLRERDYVRAARALGASDREIVLRHLLPAILPGVAVLVSLEMGELVLAISGLSFLGLGAQPPTPEWGAMLNDGRAFFFSAPRLMIYPGIAISLLVMGFNLLGDGLRDALDPALAQRTRGVGGA